MEVRRANVTQQESLIKKVISQLEVHCKQKIDGSLPSLAVSAFQVQLNAIASNLNGQIVSYASRKLVSLKGEFDDRDILQRVIGIRNKLRQFGARKVSKAWATAMAGIKKQFTSQLTQLMQELKNDIATHSPSQ